MRIRVSNVHRGLLGPDIARLHVAIFGVVARSVEKAWSVFGNIKKLNFRTLKTLTDRAVSTDRVTMPKIATCMRAISRPVNPASTFECGRVGRWHSEAENWRPPIDFLTVRHENVNPLGASSHGVGQ